MSLRDLIEVVERGELTRPGNEHWLAEMPRSTWEPIVKANSGSLDAAKALHDALLPGWTVETFNLGGEVVLARRKPIERVYGDAMHSGEVARAWLLAILRAMEAEGR